VPGRHDLRVVVSHREAVETLPHGYRVTARRPEVPIDGLEHDSLPVFTFQFHPEARREFVARRGLDPAAIDDRLVGDSDRLLDAFRRRVLSS
jgi:GMP synthase-like glutamine amidotransferase